MSRKLNPNIMSNTINITECDNQLVLFAFNGSESYEICNIESGNFNSVDIQIQLEASTNNQFSGTINANGVNKPLNSSYTVQLPTGTYSLVYAGLNWGGPYNFEFTFNNKTYKLANDPQKPLEGIVWALGNNSISFDVQKVTATAAV